MSLTDKDVKHVARLARLSLDAADVEKCREQLGRILDFVKALEKYDVSNVAPTSHVVPVTARLRDDIPNPWTDTEAILANSPDREDVYFKVKKVIE